MLTKKFLPTFKFTFKYLKINLFAHFKHIMGGNLNQLGSISHTSGFTLLRPYDHVAVTYDGLDRVTSAIYYKSSDNSVVLYAFTITYSASGWPVENTVEYKNHVFDLYQGRFVPTDATTGESAATADGGCCGFTQIVRGSCQHIYSYTTFELLSNTANSAVIWPASAEIISVVSTNAADTSAGIGLQTLTITGVDATGAEISEVITMNGTTPVLSTSSFLRINSIVGLTSGSNLVAVGNITFTNVSLDLLDTISAGFATSASLKYTVPTTQELTLKAFRINADDLSEYEIKLLIYPRSPDVPPYAYIHTVANKHSDLTLFPGELTVAAETDVAAVIRKKTGTVGVSLVTAELLATQTLSI